MNGRELPSVCRKTHLAGAIFVVTVETEAGVVTARSRFDVGEDEIVVEEREGNLTADAIASIADEFDVESARRGGVRA